MTTSTVVQLHLCCVMTSSSRSKEFCEFAGLEEPVRRGMVESCIGDLGAGEVSEDKSVAVSSMFGRGDSHVSGSAKPHLLIRPMLPF
jgi:hypothetical protein